MFRFVSFLGAVFFFLSLPVHSTELVNALSGASNEQIDFCFQETTNWKDCFSSDNDNSQDEFLPGREDEDSSLSKYKLNERQIEEFFRQGFGVPVGDSSDIKFKFRNIWEPSPYEFLMEHKFHTHGTTAKKPG